MSYMVALLIIVLGLGGQLALSLYIEPKVFSKDVVKIKADSNGLPEYTELSAENLYVDSVPSGDVPTGAFSSIEDLVGKSNVVNISDGMIVTKSLIDINKLQPKEGEGVYPIPKDAIYAINGSLRANDSVNISLVLPSTAATAEMTLPAIPDAFIEKARVAYVRTDDNNDVMDTQEGKNNDRRTSTGKVAYPEVLLTEEQGEALKQKLEAGYKLWIVRVTQGG